jgi:preprotein translocase subunit SecG
MTTFLTILHVFVCLFLILVVLLQAGKGGGMGIAFGGSGGSQTVFGSSGAGNFLTRLTSITAAIFMVTSLGLAHYSSQQDSRRLQQLDVRKKAEKKAEDERAAKLKTDLEKATQAAFPKGTTGPGTAGAAGSAVPVPPPPAAVETGARPAPSSPKGTSKDTPGKDAAPATAPTPKRRKRAPPKDEGGATAPAAPAEPAPAPPAQ